MEEKNCLICMDIMRGNVILECGHECCVNCFAQHSRINNTCPFCRKVYAPPIKDYADKREIIYEQNTVIYEAEVPSFEEVNAVAEQAALRWAAIRLRGR